MRRSDVALLGCPKRQTDAEARVIAAGAALVDSVMDWLAELATIDWQVPI
jgi:hypothetical protein